MARIKTYGQDSQVTFQDKLIGTDFDTEATKNFTVQSLLDLINQLSAVSLFDGIVFKFQDYNAETDDPAGIVNIDGGAAAQVGFSTVTQIIVSKKVVNGVDVSNYLNQFNNKRIKVSKQDNFDQYAIFDVTNVEDYTTSDDQTSSRYIKFTVSHISSNGNFVPAGYYFISYYGPSTVTDLRDVSQAGSGRIITDAERTRLQNALVHADVVDNLTSTAADLPLSANQGKALKDLIDAINTLLTVDAEDRPALDELREIVNFIQLNRADLDSLSISSISGLQDALNNKQNTETGKGLSEVNFTNLLLQKLNGIESGAQVNVQPDFSAASSDASYILNLPTNFIYTTSSATALSDINNVGSGSIITQDERNKLSGIEDNADVTPSWVPDADPNYLTEHPNISAASSVDNSGRTYIQDITLDSNGHVTAVTSATETVVDTDTTYGLTVSQNLGNAVITLEGSDDVDESITLEAGDHIDLTVGTGFATIDVDLTTAAVTDGSTSLVNGDHVYDFVTNNFLKKNQDGTFTGDLSITGDLTVGGDTITLNTETVNIEDNMILLNSNQTGTPSNSLVAGIEVERGDSSNVVIRFNEGTDKWEFTNDGTTYTEIGAASALSDLTDVLIQNLANNHFLKYNSTATKWENVAIDTDDIPEGTANLYYTEARVSANTSVAANTAKVSFPGFGTTAGTALEGNTQFVNGSGTAGKIPKFSANETIANSVISENNGDIGIGIVSSITGASDTNLHVSGGTSSEIHLTGSTGEAFNAGMHIRKNGVNSMVQNLDNGYMSLGVNNQQHMFIRPGGDIGFQGPGNVDKFFWDHSQERIGIGTATPATSLDIDATDAIVLPKGVQSERPTPAEAGMFRFNTTTSEFEGYDGVEWGAIAGSGGSETNTASVERRTYSPDGSTLDFDMGQSITDENNVFVYIDGVYQNKSTYSVSGSTLTFETGNEPPNGTELEIISYESLQATDGSSLFYDEFVGNGTQTDFDLSNAPRGKNATFVFVSGVYQEKEHYEINGSTIEFDTPPQNGYSVEVMSFSSILNVSDVGQIDHDEFTATAGQTVFDLTLAPSDIDHTDVYVNGVYQHKSTYSVSGTTLTFTTGLDVGDAVEVQSKKLLNPTSIRYSNMESDVHTATANQTTFTLTNGSPSVKKQTLVYINGVYQNKSTYSLTNGDVVLTTGADAGDEVEIVSLEGLVTSGGSAVTSVNGQTGDVTVETSKKYDVDVISADTTAEAFHVYVFTATLTLTLPASPEVGEWIKISNLSGVDTCVLGRNNNKIMGDAEDLTLDTASASFELIYSGTAQGWVIVGQ